MPPMLQAEHRGHSAIPSVAAGMGLLSVTGLALLILILRVGMTLLAHVGRSYLRTALAYPCGMCGSSAVIYRRSTRLRQR